MAETQNHPEAEDSQVRSHNRERVPAPDAAGVRPEVMALIRMLLREPPKGHDISNCPICKRYGITTI